MNVFIALNPVSGVNDSEDVHQQIEQFCQDQGWDCSIHETRPEEDLPKRVQREVKAGVDLVIAAGGDGTVAEVVGGLVGSQTPLGILPLGTGNNLARDLRIPLALGDALALLAAPDRREQELDIIQIGERYFVLNVSIGVSAETMEQTPREEKRRFGMLAYLWRGLGALWQSNMERFLVEVDGRRFRFSASELMITNDKFMGLQPQIADVEVSAEDGRLDMFIVRARSLADYLGVLARFFLPTNQRQEMRLRHLPIHSSAKVMTDRPMTVQADGEVIGKTPVELKVAPDALRVITPPKAG